MDYLNKAQALLEDTERQLRDLIAGATSNSRYDDLPTLAQIAGVIAKLRESANQPLAKNVIEASRSAKSQIEGASKVEAVDVRKSLTVKTSAVFPRFEIDGNRLVKLGWSSRDKRVYEHRVEKEVVNAICDQLIQKAGARKPFKMETFFPMHLADDSEIPSYKAYLVLKWLQHFNIIERKGKDGYIFLDKNFATDVVDDLWKQTTQRSSLEE